MKKIIIGIFAHPDDEAFGPAGTLLSEVKRGTDLHLITMTAGENGHNPDDVADLASVRLREWRQSGRLLGASSMHYLEYKDGALDNGVLLSAVNKIKDIITAVISEHDEPVDVELMSMDLNGISGHIDHIVASRAAHHVFYALKYDGLPMNRLRLYCLPREQTSAIPTIDYVYMEPGRLPEEIDQTIDNTDYLSEIISVMRSHKTQRMDGEAHIKKLGSDVAIDHFIIKE